MKKTLITEICDCIERVFDEGGLSLCQRIIVFPCGDIGIQVSNIMRNIYSIEPAYLIDNHKSRYSPNIYELSYLENIRTDDYVLLLSSKNTDIYDDLKTQCRKYFSAEKIIELESMVELSMVNKSKTICGKYSYGPLCNHPFVESVGSFTSVADGVDVVGNHAYQYLTTHDIIAACKQNYPYFDYETHKGKEWYFEGIKPHGYIEKRKPITVGNDVWIGKNVIITNSSNIGNGAIVGAGAVVTREVPDYAVVVGVPARIIRYRYSQEQINMLNKICWWSWTDDKIRECYEDFYLDIDDFIKKHEVRDEKDTCFGTTS